VLGPIGVVGVARPKPVLGLVVVLRTRVDILDHQLDRRARGLALENPREVLHLVWLAALGGEARLTGLAPIEPMLDVGFREWYARRHAVHNHADRGTVAFAPRGEAEERAEAVAGHGRPR